MGLDILIGTLLFLSAIVNVLALGAFWITPSLRTTSNRFVINLLTANLVSCVILAPSFLLNSTTNNNDFIKKNDIKTTTTTIHQLINTTTLADILPLPLPSSIALTSTTTTTKDDDDDRCKNGSGGNCVHSFVQTETDAEEIVINFSAVQKENGDGDEEVQEEEVVEVVKRTENDEEEKSSRRFEEIRGWGLDLAAALGSLSVLLVVADTWCAITDPLRYHSRISSLRAWILIAAVWIIGIIFGAGSAFRTKKIFTDLTEKEYTEDYLDGNLVKTINITSQHIVRNPVIIDDLYNTIFSCIFFIIIILLPFGLVCGMYWRIFSEARGNGLRMRQNGSSPLLQSALNLATTSSAAATASQYKQQQQQQQQQLLIQQEQTHCGLTLKIDKPNNTLSNNSNYNNIDNNNVNNNNNNNLSNNKELLYNHRTLLQVQSQPQQILPSQQQHRLQIPKSDKNHNMLLTVTENPSCTEQIRRNHSARQLFLMDKLEIINNTEIRHVHSTPNLQKLLANSEQQSHIRSGGGFNGGSTILQMPSIHVPPKALSYMTSIRHRLSNASSLFKYREESRAARISILVVIMFLVSYLPYGIIILLQGHFVYLSSYIQALIAIITVVIANISSPFIFAYRNKRVRRGVKRLLGIDRKTNEKRFQKHQSTYKTTVAKVKRSCSKASTNSTNSTRYLTPHSANTLKGTTFVLEIDKCGTTTTTTDDELSYEEKKSFLKRICDTSRKWDCTLDSCTGTDVGKHEKTDV